METLLGTLFFVGLFVGAALADQIGERIETGALARGQR